MNSSRKIIKKLSIQNVKACLENYTCSAWVSTPITSKVFPLDKLIFCSKQPTSSPPDFAALEV